MTETTTDTKLMIPAQPGFELLTAYFPIYSGDQNMFFTRTPIIAWRLDDCGDFMPVVPLDRGKPYRDDKETLSAVRFPDGQVEIIDGERLDDWAEWVEFATRRDARKILPEISRSRRGTNRSVNRLSGTTFQKTGTVWNDQPRNGKIRKQFHTVPLERLDGTNRKMDGGF